MDQKGNLEQISLQCDDLVAYNQGLEQAMEEVCTSVPELAMPVELPATEKIHHITVGLRRAQEETGKAQLELNLQIAKLRMKV